MPADARHPRPGDPILERTSRLAADHGHEVTLALTGESLPGGPTRLGDVRVVEAADATAPFDMAVAAGWSATVALFGVPATRHAMLVSELEHEQLGTWQPERLPASLAYDLPVDFVATAGWVRDALAELRPDARCVVARDGVDKALFATAGGAPADGPLRVLVDDRHALDHAASPERRALAAASQPLHPTFVEADDDARRRAVKLGSADVVLHLPAGSGVLGTPLEGFHAGATAVVTATADQTELVRHGENGLVVDHDDERGAAAQLDRLARDRAALSSLREAATRTAAEWPSLDEAGAELSHALEELLATPPPDAVRWPVRLMSDAVAGSAILRQELAETTAELNRHRNAALVRLEARARARWHQDDLAPLRRVAGPVLRRARARLMT